MLLGDFEVDKGDFDEIERGAGARVGVGLRDFVFFRRRGDVTGSTFTRRRVTSTMRSRRQTNILVRKTRGRSLGQKANFHKIPMKALKTT